MAVANYAGCIGSQYMGTTYSSCDASSIVGNGGSLFDQDEDGQDWFNATATMTPACTSIDKGNVRADCPNPEFVSGVFARASWAAAIREITDGTSDIIAIGEIRPRCSAFQWIYGWAGAEGFYFATTAPINFNTCDDVLGETRPPCQDFERDFALAMGFKSLHPGGANVAFCDGSTRFLTETIDYTTYQKLGARADGYSADE